MKIGMTLSRNKLEEPLAAHFGKAKWLLVYDTSGSFEFFPNHGLNGRAVAETFRAAGCTEVIAAHLGAGAFNHLRQEGIRVRRGEDGVPAADLVRRYQAGELDELDQVESHAHGGGGCGGCGCSH